MIRRVENTGFICAPYMKGFYFCGQEGKDLLYAEDSELTKQCQHMPGQIQRSNKFGEMLYDIARTGPTNWLEVGTWNGLGSTQCILDGFIGRPEAKLTSLEIDPCMFAAAGENLKNHPARACVRFIHGKLWSNQPVPEFPTMFQLPVGELGSAHFYIHYEREKALYEEAYKFVPESAPDVVVLDGGEYSGYFDWLHVDKSALKYVFLDDTHTFKNAKIVEELTGDARWSCMARGSDRNGWAVFCRVGAP